MSLRNILMFFACLSMAIGAALAFDWYHVDDPHLAGWFFLAFGFWFTSDLVGDR